MTLSDAAVDIEALWEYGDPSLSEERFRRAMHDAQGDYRLELETQIARALGLRGRFVEAHALLDEVQRQLTNAGASPRVRYLLERGRALNSSGDKVRARMLFADAWEQAKDAGLMGLAVDAAHMLAIVQGGTRASADWTERGLKLARRSKDPKAQALVPAMLNNGAWELHQRGRYGKALKLFEEARTEWEKLGRPEQIRIARWSVARCLRSMGRHDEALLAQRSLEADHAQDGSADGYVFEEIAENLEALGRTGEAAHYFRKAFDELSRDTWFSENEQERLAHLMKRAGR